MRLLLSQCFAYPVPVRESKVKIIRPAGMSGDDRNPATACPDVFFHLGVFGDNPKSAEADAYMEKVVWVDPHYKTLWGRFRTSVKVGNYSELLGWLKARWLKATQRNYKYQVDGKIVEAVEFDNFLKQHKPYHILRVGQKNPPYTTDAFGEPTFWCPDPHQKPHIQKDICIMGCKCCFAVEEISKNEHLVYCKRPLPKRTAYIPKTFVRVYKYGNSGSK